MTQKSSGTNWMRWVFCVVVASCLIAAGGYYLSRSLAPPTANAQENPSHPEQPSGTHVEVVHPRLEEVGRTTTQPGSVQSFESVRLFAEVSGYLKTLNVDIGDRVKKGDVLAVVDVPELRKQVQRHSAALEQTRARVLQMKARVASAEADLDAAKAAVAHAEALAKSKAAEARFRSQQLRRMRELFALKSIDERLVDEKTEQRDAAREAQLAAEAAVVAAKAQVTASAAKIRQAESDVAEAKAEVKVAQAELEKAQVLVQFATIGAPFNGVVSQRGFFPGDYVRSANEGGAATPLLTVHRTDKLRVVVQIPDRDVPYADPGDPAVVEIDALPGQSFQAKLSRIAQAEDPESRLMRVEIDLPNPTGKICNGMYGRVTISLDRAKLLAIPSACLVGRTRRGKGKVFVVRDGRARLTAVEIGADNGLQVGIARGLQSDDEIIMNPASGIAEGTPVLVSGRHGSVHAAN